MTRAFFYLMTRSMVNRTRERLRRLKQPKYLIGAIVGLLYFYGYFFRFLFRGGGAGQNMLEEASSVMVAVGSVILLLLCLGAWIFPGDRAALIFSEAEIAFLFPAPVTRRGLVHYKLLKSQLAILFTVLLLTLLTGRIFTSSHALIRVLGWWVMLSTLNLHFLGASFTRTLLLERGVTNWVRRIVVLLLAAGIGAVAVIWARQTHPLPPWEQGLDWAAWSEYLGGLLGSAPLSWLLFPFRLIVQPYLASGYGEFLMALAAALPVLGLHYVWVLNGNVAFEEASLVRSQRLAERVAAVRAGRGLEVRPGQSKRAPFPLRAGGWPALGFLWKNLISVQSTFRLRALLIMALPLLVVGLVFGGQKTGGPVVLGSAAVLTFMFFIWSLLIGAQFVRCDLRQDLPAMDLLKLYPLPGWQIVAGELLAPLAILSVVQWFLLLLLGVLLSFGAIPDLPSLALTWLVCAAILAPFWNALVLLIPNAAVLWFPAWFESKPGTPQGIEVTGQRLLLLLGQLVAIGLTLVPAALAFALGFFPLRYLGLEALAPIAGGLGGAVVLTGEVALGVLLVGRLLERFDLAAETR